MGGHMFVDFFLTPIKNAAVKKKKTKKNAAVAVILISIVRPFAYPVQFYW